MGSSGIGVEVLCRVEAVENRHVAVEQDQIGRIRFAPAKQDQLWRIPGHHHIESPHRSGNSSMISPLIDVVLGHAGIRCAVCPSKGGRGGSGS